MLKSKRVWKIIVFLILYIAIMGITAVFIYNANLTQKDSSVRFLHTIIAGGLCLIPLSVAIITAVYIWNIRGEFWATLIVITWIIGGIILLIFFTIFIGYNEHLFLILGLFSFLILVVHVWQLNDITLGSILGFVPPYALLFAGLSYIASNSEYYFVNTSTFWAIFLTSLLFPLSFLLHSANFFLFSKWIQGIASMFIAFLLFIIVINTLGPLTSYLPPHTGLGSAEFDSNLVMDEFIILPKTTRKVP